MDDKILRNIINKDREIISSLAEMTSLSEVSIVPDNAKGVNLFYLLRTGILYLLLLIGAVSINYKIIKALDNPKKDNGIVPSIVVMNAEYEGSVNRALERLFEHETNS